jgi:hypothetical protein
MRVHERYEILCALAVSSQLTESELHELRVHMAQCSDCRSRLQDMAQVSAQALLPLNVMTGQLPEGMAERFMQRAWSEGVPLKRISAYSFEKWKTCYYGGLAAAILLAVLTAANYFKSEAWTPLSFPVAGSQLRVANADITRASVARAPEVIATTKELHQQHRRRTAKPLLETTTVLQPSVMRVLNNGPFGPTQDGVRQFRYNPSAARLVPSLQARVDWYRVWMESQKNAKRLEISFQPEWKAGMVP